MPMDLFKKQHNQRNYSNILFVSLSEQTEATRLLLLQNGIEWETSHPVAYIFCNI